MAGTVRADWRCLAGIIAGPLFVGIFLIAGAITPGYSVARHPVSTLALGEFGWLQTLSFIVTGILVIAFATLFWRERRALSVFLLIAGAGLAGAGVFRTDPMAGFPPDALPTVAYSMFGLLHEIFSLLFFIGLPLAAVAVAMRFARMRRPLDGLYSMVSAAVFLIFFILAGIGFDGSEGFAEWGGLMQRISIAAGLGWLSVFAQSIRRGGLAVLSS
jgi:hypothetical membrane protein